MKIFAEASVNSIGGVSMFRTLELITSENVTNFHSDPRLAGATSIALEIFGRACLTMNCLCLHD